MFITPSSGEKKRRESLEHGSQPVWHDCSSPEQWKMLFKRKQIAFLRKIFWLFSVLHTYTKTCKNSWIGLIRWLNIQWINGINIQLYENYHLWSEYCFKDHFTKHWMFLLWIGKACLIEAKTNFHFIFFCLFLC